MDLGSARPYRFELAFLASTIALGVAGFWKLYVGAGASPDAHQDFHAATNFAWLLLLSCQLTLVARGRHGTHRRVGLAVLFLGPFLVASTALLSVHSAHKGVVSGEGDFLIVQNVGVTLELGLLIFLAFVFRKRRQLHAAFMLGTAMLFMGIALFFTLIGFAPMFRIEGPETFGRFAQAAMAGQAICLAVGVLFVIRDFRNGWPLLLAAAFFPLNELVRSLLTARKLIGPLTEHVGAMSQPLTFVATFVVLLALLAATGMLRPRAPARTIAVGAAAAAR